LLPRHLESQSGLGRTWVPRELRRTFVSLLSARSLPEATTLLAGHNQTATTELVYRHQIVPAPTRGAEVMDQIFVARRVVVLPWASGQAGLCLQVPER
jgi:hypothetical protein